MSDLTNQFPSASYQGLLQIPGSLQPSTYTIVQDGLGNNSALGLSQTGIQINGFTLTVGGTSSINGTLNGAVTGTVTGNGILATGGFTLTIGGTSSINGTFSGNFSGTSSGTNTGDQTISLTGDVTGSGAGSFATTIGTNKVTYAKFQQVAGVSLIGNATASLATMTGITLGSTLSFNSTVLQTAAMTGDITASANSYVTTIGSNKVSYAKMQQVSAGKLLGSSSVSAANIAEVSIGSGLSLAFGVLSSTAGGINSITGQIFTSSGSFTYTPTAGTKYAIVTLISGGGAGGGVTSLSTSSSAGGSGGGAGAQVKFILSAAQIGSSLTGSVGAGGAANTGATGSNGASTTLATSSAWTVTGGSGGIGVLGSASSTGANGSTGGTVSAVGTGTVLENIPGGAGGDSATSAVTALLGFSGIGGSNPSAQGGRAHIFCNGITVLGTAGLGAGAGGSGALNVAVSGVSTSVGGIGNTGIAIFEEFN